MTRYNHLSRRDVVRASLTAPAIGIAAALAPIDSLAAPSFPSTGIPERFQSDEHLSFDQQIITPQGTPLGGNVYVELYKDGRTYVKFHMHSSSIFGDFDFNLRAYVTAAGSPAFAFLHSGHVSGVDNADYEEWGSNALIPIYWPSLQNAQYNVAKDYTWGGIVGAFESLVNDLLDLGASVLGATLGTIVGATREALDWLGVDLGPGGAIGVISGVVIFAVGVATGGPIGATLVAATVTGAEIGAVLETMISTRPLNNAEITIGRSVFGDTVPYDKVMLTNLTGLGGRAFTIPGVDGFTYINLGSDYDDPIGATSNSYPMRGQLLVHELTHAWQIAHSTFLPGLLCSMVVNQERNTFGDSVYQYDGPGPDWNSFNAEQQGSIVDDWFAAVGKSNLYRPLDQGSPFYRYVWEDVLQRQLPIGAPGNIRASSTSAVSRVPGHLDCFYPTRDGSTGSVWWDQSGGWMAPFTVSGFQSMVQSGVATVSRYAGHLDLFWTTPNGEVGTTWWETTNPDNGGWGGAFTIAPPGSALPQTVTAVSRFASHLDVFWVAADGSIATTSVDTDANNGAWGTPSSITPPGFAAGGVAAVSRGLNHLDVFWIGLDGAVWSTWWDLYANNLNWAAPFVIAPAGSARRGGITVSCRNPEHLDVFWTAPDGSVGTAWWDGKINDANWNAPFTIAGPGSAASAIATVCRTPDQVDVYWIAPDGSIGTTWWAPDPGWNAPFSLTPGGVADVHSPISVVTQSPRSIDVFWHTPDGALGTVYWYEGGGGWAGWFAITQPETLAAGSATSNLGLDSGEVVSQWPGHLDVFYPTPDNSVGSVWWDQVATWSGPFLVAGPESSGSPAIAALVRYGGHLDTFYVAADGSIATAWWQAGANEGAWPGPYTIWGPGTAATPATVSAVSDVPWRISLFWLMPDNSIGNTTWNSASGNLNWSAPASISTSGSATDTIAAIGRKPGHLDVFWVATDGSVNSVWWDERQNSGAWAAEFSIAPAGSALPASIVASSRFAEHIDVFWVMPDGAVQSAWWDGPATGPNWNAPFTLAGPGSAIGPVAVVNRMVDKVDVFWVAPDGSIWTAWWAGSWNAPYAMTPAGVAGPGSPLSAVAQNPNHLDVFWHTPDGAVGTTYWDASVVGWGQWYTIMPDGNVAVSAGEPADTGAGTDEDTPPRPDSPTGPRGFRSIFN
jgi:hypothetical protein